jgi:excisionase family DNA binding protein
MEWKGVLSSPARHYFIGEGTMLTSVSTPEQNTPTGFEPLLKSEQAAALLQIHPKTLQKLARQGKIPAKRIGDLWRFRASDLEDWVRGRDKLGSPLVP